MSKTVRYLLTGCVAIILLLGSFSSGVLVGWFLPHENPVAGVIENDPVVPFPSNDPTNPGSSQPQSTEELFEPFWDVWEIVKSEYVDQPVDEVAMMRGAIQGMLESLGDEHTAYMDPEQYEQSNAEMQGEYDGIGAWVDTEGEYLTIISPMDDSPAQKAGLKAGDQVIAVDGEDVTGTPANLVLRKVLGPAGTDVTLTIRREDTPDPFDVTITRAKIVLKSVESEMLEGDIAYVAVNTFGDKTTAELTAALETLMAQKPSGMILDLRNNGGGYLNTAIEVVSQFIPDGVVMYEEYGDGTRDTYEAMSGGLATEIPLVVLVNEGTASASEITAGAIQDYARGKLVGVTTFGKGSVQSWIPLRNDAGAVRVTIARWLTPKERLIHKVGLEPDFVVELTEEDVEAERDPQLDKAIEVLRQGQ